MARDSDGGIRERKRGRVVGGEAGGVADLAGWILTIDQGSPAAPTLGLDIDLSSSPFDFELTETLSTIANLSGGPVTPGDLLEWTIPIAAGTQLDASDVLPDVTVDVEVGGAARWASPRETAAPSPLPSVAGGAGLLLSERLDLSHRSVPMGSGLPREWKLGSHPEGGVRRNLRKIRASQHRTGGPELACNPV